MSEATRAENVAPKPYDLEAHYQELEQKITAAGIPADLGRVRAAFECADRAHSGQKRRDGSPYVSHCIAAAIITAEMGLDEDSIIAALLHDTIEDTSLTHEDIARSFGTSVADIVEGVTKLTRVQYTSVEEQQMENMRKMLLAMAKDIRVILIKIADRTHNMRTMEYQSTDKQRQKSLETMEIYAPIAHRLGMQRMKWELEDLSLKYLDPTAFNEITHSLEEKSKEYGSFMERIQKQIEGKLTEDHIPFRRVYGRMKHPYSIYRKMYAQSKTMDEVFDLFAFRVIVDTVADCYNVLGVIHDLYRPVLGRFKDYIGTPKPNGYQSLHTVVTDKAGRPIEIQIRTRAMHEFAELGVAAHWRYKEAGNSLGASAADEQRVAWLRQLLAWRSDMTKPEGGEAVQDDHVYCLTPQGRVVELPQGATPVDFAYLVHTELGHRMKGAKVDGVMVALNYKLQTGQTVEIIAGKVGQPSRDWLNPELGYAASPRTRNKVRQWFNAQLTQRQIAEGRERIDKELARLGKTAVKLEALAKRLGFDSVDNLCLSFAKDELSITALQQAVMPEKEAPKEEEPSLVSAAKPTKASGQVLVVGVDSLLTQLARCCHPVPPDEIVGYVTRGRGVTIHRADCPNLKQLSEEDHERLIEVSWGKARADSVYPAELLIVANERLGLLKDLSEIFVREKHRVTGLSTQVIKGDTHMRFKIETPSTEGLKRVLALIREVPGVLWAKRI